MVVQPPSERFEPSSLSQHQDEESACARIALASAQLSFSHVLDGGEFADGIFAFTINSAVLGAALMATRLPGQTPKQKCVLTIAPHELTIHNDRANVQCELTIPAAVELGSLPRWTTSFRIGYHQAKTLMAAAANFVRGRLVPQDHDCSCLYAPAEQMLEIRWGNAIYRLTVEPINEKPSISLDGDPVDLPVAARRAIVHGLHYASLFRGKQTRAGHPSLDTVSVADGQVRGGKIRLRTAYTSEFLNGVEFHLLAANADAARSFLRSMRDPVQVHTGERSLTFVDARLRVEFPLSKHRFPAMRPICAQFDNVTRWSFDPSEALDCALVLSIPPADPIARLRLCQGEDGASAFMMSKRRGRRERARAFLRLQRRDGENVVARRGSVLIDDLLEMTFIPRDQRATLALVGNCGMISHSCEYGTVEHVFAYPQPS